MSLPSTEIIRERIEQVQNEDIQMCLKACYLFAGRITEVIGKVTLGDKTSKQRIARGGKKEDARLDSLLDHNAFLFNVYTAKREGKRRIIALPDQEKWAQKLYDYYKSADDFVFPFTRQKVWQYSVKAFEGLQYPIETYAIWKNGEIIKKVNAHEKPFRLHALRHLRITELIEFYGFNGFEVATYCGWTLKTSLGIGGQFDRYAHLDWQSYFPKLLKAR